MMMEMVELPLKITAEIFSRLPVDSIIELKLVCKTWRTLINNDIRYLLAYNNLAMENQQLGGYGESSYKEEEEENLIASWAILGSSNGLICLSACRLDEYGRKSFTYNIYVYNPTTREFVEVWTETCMGDDDGCCRGASGFGYHPSTNKYKVVRIKYYKTTYSSSPSEGHVVSSSPSGGGHVSVYTLGSGGASGWRDIGEIPYVISGPGVLVNGALYWITLDKKILSFDLADEEFRIVSKNELINCTRLGVFRGCLSAVTSSAGDDDDHRWCTDVWIMNNNNNKLYMSSKSNSNRTTQDDDQHEPSWTRLPRIEFNSYFIDHSDFNEISSYGFKYECFGRFFNFYSSRELHLNLHHLVPYTKGFVSLKALGEENVKKICNKKLARLKAGRQAGRQACSYLI